MYMDSFEINVWRGPEFQESCSFEPGRYIVGRSSACDVVLAHPLVSRQHCCIEYREGRWFVEDLGTPNGLVLDGALVRLAPLDDGSKILLDPFELDIRMGERTDPLTRMPTPQTTNPTAHLVVLTQLPQIRVPLTARLTRMGRGDRSPLHLEDPHVSRTHAIVRRVEGQYLIEDQDSANGTYVNTRKVRRTKLRDGDEIRLGAQLVRFELG